MSSTLTADQQALLVTSVKAAHPDWDDAAVTKYLADRKATLEAEAAAKAAKKTAVKAPKVLSAAQIDALLMGKSIKKRTPKAEARINWADYPGLTDGDLLCFPVGGKDERHFCSIFRVKTEDDGKIVAEYLGAKYRVGVSTSYRWGKCVRNAEKYPATPAGDAAFRKANIAENGQDLGTITLHKFQAFFDLLKPEQVPVYLKREDKAPIQRFKSLCGATTLKSYICIITGYPYETATTPPDCKTKNLNKLSAAAAEADFVDVEADAEQEAEAEAEAEEEAAPAPAPAPAPVSAKAKRGKKANA